MRVARRHDVNIDMLFELETRNGSYGRMLDISETGFCLKTSSRNLFLFDELTFNLRNLIDIKAQIRWLERGRVVGCEFFTPLTGDRLSDFFK